MEALETSLEWIRKRMGYRVVRTDTDNSLDQFLGAMGIEKFI
jgi:hypothetical protein